MLAEDDENLRFVVQDNLELRGYRVVAVENGEDALSAFREDEIDLCIFDVMMPHMDGFTLAREIRKHNKEVPIVFLTAKSMKDDAIEGFKVGADDYITKPFSMEELILRIKAILKRTERSVDETPVQEYKLGKYTFNTTHQQLILGDIVQKLTSREADLLKLLCVNINDTLERNFALRTIWSDDNYFNARSMDVYIARLRKYLSGDPSLEIINVHGKGFKLVDEHSAS